MIERLRNTCHEPLDRTGCYRTVIPAFAVAAVMLAGTVAADSVHYVLTPLVESGRLRVELTWNTRGRTQSALTVSRRWGTVNDVPALIQKLQFAGVSDVRRQGTRWLLRHPRGGSITCRYEVDPRRRELTWDATHYPVTTDTFFHGMGNAFLLVPQAGGGLPEEYEVTLRWKLPKGWKAVCSWGTAAHVGAVLTPDDLRHSVYLAGEIVTRTEKRDGRKVTVAMLDRFGFSAEDFAELAAKIVGYECDFMQEEDFPPFLVTAVPVGEPVKPGDARLSGMGLCQSFALFCAPQGTLTDAFEHLFAHELFHYWNGRVLKAKEPDKLVYWFVEGFTDYYSLRILYESGHWQPGVYAKWINRHLHEYHGNPAIHATNEDINARYWKERDTVGEVPYQRGLLLGLRWHRLARDHGVADGIDRLFKTLVERGRRGSFELSNQAIRQTGIRSLGAWFGPEFDRFVRDADTVVVPTDVLTPGLTGRVTAVYEYELGFDRARSLKQRRVRGLIPGAAAAQAGLCEGDELAGWKIRGDVDEQVKLNVRREGKSKTISYYPRGKRINVLQFVPSK